MNTTRQKNLARRRASSGPKQLPSLSMSLSLFAQIFPLGLKDTALLAETCTALRNEYKESLDDAAASSLLRDVANGDEQKVGKKLKANSRILFIKGNIKVTKNTVYPLHGFQNTSGFQLIIWAEDKDMFSIVSRFIRDNIPIALAQYKEQKSKNPRKHIEAIQTALRQCEGQELKDENQNQYVRIIEETLAQAKGQEERDLIKYIRNIQTALQKELKDSSEYVQQIDEALGNIEGKTIRNVMRYIKNMRPSTQKLEEKEVKTPGDLQTILEPLEEQELNNQHVYSFRRLVRAISAELRVDDAIKEFKAELEADCENYGKQLYYAVFIDAVKTYIKNYFHWNETQRSLFYNDVIGHLQQCFPSERFYNFAPLIDAVSNNTSLAEALAIFKMKLAPHNIKYYKRRFDYQIFIGAVEAYVENYFRWDATKRLLFYKGVICHFEKYFPTDESYDFSHLIYAISTNIGIADELEIFRTETAPKDINSDDTYDYQLILDALQVYITNFPYWDLAQRTLYSCEVIRYLQQGFSVYLAQAYPGGPGFIRGDGGMPRSLSLLGQMNFFHAIKNPNLVIYSGGFLPPMVGSYIPLKAAESDYKNLLILKNRNCTFFEGRKRALESGTLVTEEQSQVCSVM